MDKLVSDLAIVAICTSVTVGPLILLFLWFMFTVSKYSSMPDLASMDWKDVMHTSFDSPYWMRFHGLPW